MRAERHPSITPRQQTPSRESLVSMIAAVQGRDSRDHRAIHIGLPAPLDQLPCGMLHEWCGDSLSRPQGPSSRAWAAPILLLAHLARRCQDGLILWIGRKLWPQPWVLVHRGMPSDDLLQRSVLVDPQNQDDRLWAIDLCLRSSAVGAVIADASGMTLAHSRRLQLAAEAGNALALLARPDRELSMPSAATMRWRIGPVATSESQPRWRVERVRCKAMQRWTGMDAATSLVLEHDRATGDLRVPAALADRPNSASIGQEQGRESTRSTFPSRRAG